MRWISDQELPSGHGFATPAEVLREMGATVAGFLAFALTTHLLLIVFGL